MMHTSEAEREVTESKAYCLWGRILGLVEQDLAERCARRLFVEVRDEGGGSYRYKEIEDLSAPERQGLHPALRGHVVELLLDRHLARQGRVDLLEKRRAYTKEVEELTPEDLPALIEADRLRAEEEHQRGLLGREEEFAREARADLEQLLLLDEHAEITQAGKGVRR